MRDGPVRQRASGNKTIRCDPAPLEEASTAWRAERTGLLDQFRDSCPPRFLEAAVCGRTSQHATLPRPGA
jgi:hypothetical protein